MRRPWAWEYRALCHVPEVLAERLSEAERDGWRPWGAPVAAEGQAVVVLVRRRVWNWNWRRWV